MMTEKEKDEWNFETFEKYINQRFTDLSIQLRERYDSQQSAIASAFEAAEKTVNTALVAAQKAIDKSEQAQELRNEQQNELHKSLSEMSGIMWTIKEGSAAVDSLRREFYAGLQGLEKKLETMETAKHASQDLENRRVSALETRIAEMVTREADKKEGISFIGAIVMAIATGVAAAASVVSALVLWHHGGGNS